MKHLSVVFGLGISCIVVAIANVLFTRYGEFNFFTFTLWFVVPVGAYFCGMIGVSGGILAAYLSNHRPKVIDAISMVLFAVGTMVLIYYLDYRTLVIDKRGTKASDVVSFLDYVAVVTTKAKHQAFIRGRPVGEAYEVGEAGYGYMALYFCGFIAGGVSAYLMLRSAAHCPKCDAYLRTLKAEMTPPLELTELQAIHGTISSGALDTVIPALKWRPVRRKDNRETYKCYMIQKVEVCPLCKTELLSCSVYARKKDNSWVLVPELEIYRVLSDGLSLRGVLPSKKFSPEVMPLPGRGARQTQDAP